MMSKHTPGPWEAVQDDSGEWAIWHSYGDKGQFCTFNVIGINDEADARLIAAAPEMLELVQYALAVTKEGLPLGKQWKERTREAIAKAKGETE